MPIHNVTLELPYPPNPDTLVDDMRAAIDAHVPTGERLDKMLGKHSIGPDLGEDFQPCWRMEVSFATVEIDPLTWEGD